MPRPHWLIAPPERCARNRGGRTRLKGAAEGRGFSRALLKPRPTMTYIQTMPVNRAACLIAVLGALACSTPSAGAQTPVRWTATAPSAPVTPGSTTSVVLKANIDEGWHIYAINQGAGGPVPTRITLAPEQPFALAGAVRATLAPRTEMDASFGINVMLHEKNAAFVVPVRLDPAVRSGIDTVHVNARYQACNASLCLPPQTARLTAAVLATGGK